MNSPLFFLALLALVVVSNAFILPMSSRISSTCRKAIERDSQGYEVKPRDWFNGLSGDPGNSIADPRSVPPICREFAEKIKNGGEVANFAETMKLIDEHYTYFEVPFAVGDVRSAANENTGSAKVFSFGLMTRMDEKSTLKLFGEHYKAVLANPSGTDHANIRSFMKNGFPGVEFPSGLAIVSKLQAYEDTDSAFATQAKISGEEGWDADSDSWIP
jgi:hypothetical protein